MKTISKKLTALLTILLAVCSTSFSQDYDDLYYTPDDDNYSHFVDSDESAIDSSEQSKNSEYNYITNNYYYPEEYEYDEYYDDYDYYYSSRIRRFYRPYYGFSYYDPIYSDLYWYDYSPYSYGISIHYSPWYSYGGYFGHSYGWGGYYGYSYWNTGYCGYGGYCGNYWYPGYNGYRYGYWNGYRDGYSDGYWDQGYAYNSNKKSGNIYYGHRGSLSNNAKTNRGRKYNSGTGKSNLGTAGHTVMNNNESNVSNKNISNRTPSSLKTSPIAAATAKPVSKIEKVRVFQTPAKYATASTNKAYRSDKNKSTYNIHASTSSRPETTKSNYYTQSKNAMHNSLTGRKLKYSNNANSAKSTVNKPSSVTTRTSSGYRSSGYNSKTPGSSSVNKSNNPRYSRPSSNSSNIRKRGHRPSYYKNTSTRPSSINRSSSSRPSSINRSSSSRPSSINRSSSSRPSSINRSSSSRPSSINRSSSSRPSGGSRPSGRSSAGRSRGRR